ncbi:MAG: hypothetical protein WBD50_03470, partial [Candidatus Rhabdochlamydia sp.]
MILEKIRTAFPEINRTQEQDLLIGSTCLALTDQERDTIENLNFNKYQSSLDEKKSKKVSLRVVETVANAQWWGKVSGFATGSVSAGTAAWYLAALSPLLTAASGGLGGYLGFEAGKIMGGDIGHELAMENEINEPEFICWKDEKYATVILPALSRYVDLDKEESKTQLTCPITLDWMVEPVRAKDGHVYEKAAIIRHLATWPGRVTEILALRPIQTLTPKDAQEILNTSSPLRNGFISIDELKELPGYYEETVRSLISKYNMKVLNQRTIVDQNKDQTQELPEEVAKVVRFYSMTQERRDHIKADMRRDLLIHRVFRPDEQTEEDQALDLLTAAAKPPELI